MLLTILLLLSLPQQRTAQQRPPDLNAPLASPSVLQSVGDGYPLLGKLEFTEGVEKTMVDVILESDEGQALDRTTSSPNGEFRFKAVKLGRYWLVIEGEKFENVRERLEVDVRTFGVVNVTLVLHPRNGIRASGSGENVVSVDSLRRKAPKDAMKEYEKALDEQRKGDPKKVLDHLQKAIKIFPDFYDAHLQLGSHFQKAGNRPEAIKSFEKAVELDPASIKARNELGQLYLDSQEYEKAAGIEEEALKIGRVTADNFFILGTAYYKLNELDLAEENLQRALTLSPASMGNAHLQLYNVYMRGRQPMKALEQLDTYLTSFPKASNRDSIQEQADKLRQSLRR